MFFDAAVPDAIARGLVLSVMGLAWVIVLVRITGLRSFSKMTSFDFVTTLAVGSLMSALAQGDTWLQLLQITLAMAALFLAQAVAAKLRNHSDRVERAMQNVPVLLAHDGVILDNALRVTRVARSDVIAKLRLANVSRLADVRAVVLETTGDISVLAGDGIDEDEMLTGVSRV